MPWHQDDPRMVKIGLTNLLRVPFIARTRLCLFVHDEAFGALHDSMRVFDLSDILEVEAVLGQAHAEETGALNWRYSNHLFIDKHATRSVLNLSCSRDRIDIEIHRLLNDLFGQRTRNSIHFRLDLDNSVKQVRSLLNRRSHVFVSLIQRGYQLRVKSLVLDNASIATAL